MKTTIQAKAAYTGGLLALTLLTATPLYAAPENIMVARHPTDAIYPKSATARLYVNAYSANNGYLEYQWYRSQLFDKPLKKPAGGYTEAQKKMIKANAIPLPEGVAATLVTTTPANFAGVKYCYYWVKIKNSRNGKADYAESEYAEVKIVDRTLPNRITNSDFSTAYAPLNLPVFEWSNGGKNVGAWYTIVSQDRLPNWKTTDFNRQLGNIPNFGDIRQSFQVFCLNEKPFGYKVSSIAEMVPNPVNPVAATTNPTQAAVQKNQDHLKVTTKHGDKGGDKGNFGAIELTNTFPSSVYQEVATVPGKIYEWSIDHSQRNNRGPETTDVMAVVIGAAVNEKSELGSDQNLWENDNVEELHYPYGASFRGNPEQSPTYFYKIIETLATTCNTTPPELTKYSGRFFAQRYNNCTYYVHILATGAAWTTYTGVYTVPDGQGTTVFGFVGIYPQNGSGNVLDNINFASNISSTPSPKLTHTREVIQLSNKTKAGFAYGIATVRGSSASLAPNAVAYCDPDGNGPKPEAAISPNSNGWYYYGEGRSFFTDDGVITFRNLTPGKIYRIVGIPNVAVNSDFRVNENPVYVLDDGYYKNVKIGPASMGNDSTTWGVTVTLYTEADGVTKKARIGVQHAPADVEYALLADSVDARGAHHAVTAAPAHPNTGWTTLGEAGLKSAFYGLDLDAYYHLVARPYGYEEVTYAEAAYDVDGVTPASIRIKTPSISTPDVDSSSVSRDGCTVIKIAHTKSRYTYAIVDPKTNRIVGRTQPGTGGTISFDVPDAGKAYQAMAKSGDVSWLEGVRAYGCPDNFWVDYRNEAVKSARSADGNIPTGVEYRIAANDASSTPVTGGWTAGTGNQPVNLSGKMLARNTVSVLDSLTSLGADATLRYRVKAGLDGYAGRWVAPAKAVAVPRRGAPPAATADYRFSYEHEKVTVRADSLQLAQANTQAWTSIVRNSSWDFSAAGWGEGTSERAFEVRYPATSTSFASAVSSDTIPARPKLTDNLTLADNSAGNGGAVSKAVICNLKPGKTYQYKTDLTAGWVTFTPNGEGKSDSIPFTASSDCNVRLAATASAPASLPVTLVANRISIQPVYFFDQLYGSSTAMQNIIIKNSNAKKNFRIISLAIDGNNSDKYELQNRYSDSVIAAGNTNAHWKLRPRSNLNAGTHNATLKLLYSYGGVKYEASAGVYLTIRKTLWDIYSLKGEIDASQTKADKLALHVSGAPAGSRLVYHFDRTPVPGNAESAIAAHGRDTFTFTAANGLEPSSIYVISVRAEEDNNHYRSALTMLAMGYTAYATPVFEKMVSVNYPSELLEPAGGYFGSSYTLGCASCGGLQIPNPSTPFSLSNILNNKANDSIVFFIVHNAADGFPASDTGYSATFLGRTAAPTVVNATVTHASSATSGDGAIAIAGAFEYRSQNTGGEWMPAENLASRLGVGDYEICYPAAAGKNGKFASQTALATVSTILAQPAPITVAKENISPASATLSVAIPATTNTVAYQWYTKTATGSSAIPSATGSKYPVPQALKRGVYDYYCVVTFGGVSTLASSAAAVTVTDAVTIAISHAALAPKTYDGEKTATVSSLTFSNLKAGDTLRPGEDYTVDSARFADANAGDGVTALLYVSLNPNSARANIYSITNGAGFLLRGQRIQKAKPDTTFLAFDRNSVAAYDGSPHKLHVALKSKYSGMDSITVKYNNSATPPIDARAYSITADIVGNANFSDSIGLPLGAQFAIAPDTIAIAFARILQKTYDGASDATVDSVAFAGRAARYELVRGSDYSVDSASFDNPNAGRGKTVAVYVSLKERSEKAKNYRLRSRAYRIDNQAIWPAPQAIRFLSPLADTAIYVRDGTVLLSATATTPGRAPLLPVRFSLKPDNTQDATLGANTLTPMQPGTVRVTAYVKHDDSYEDAATVQRSIVISDLDSCTVTFAVSAGAGLEAKVAKGDTVGRPFPDPPGGIAFDGWYADTTYKTKWDFSRYRVRRNVTLYARWRYRVAFEHRDNGATRNDVAAVAGGNVAPQPTDPTRKGYAFGGWWHATPAGEKKWIFSSATVTRDTTLFAKWSAIRYSITYNNAAGATHQNPDTFTVESDIRLNDAAKNGYHFAGWYADAAFGGNAVTTIPKGSTGNTTLWARWKKLYAVRFSSDGVEIPEYRRQVAHGDTVRQPQNPTKANAKFDGWYANAALALRWNFSTGTVTRDTTLYASWTTSSSIVINGAALVMTGDTIRYIMECREQSIWVFAPAFLSDTLRIANLTFAHDTIIALGGEQDPHHMLWLVKPFEFDSIVNVQLDGKLMMVVKNPANNRGFNIKKVQWWRKGKDGWEAAGRKLYYAALSGEVITDTVYAQLWDAAGTNFATCPYNPTAHAQDKAQIAVYPNPVMGGGAIRIGEKLFTDSALEERYETFRLFDAQGALLLVGKTSELRTGVSMPVNPGIYYLVLEGNAGQKPLKVVVRQRL
jgi:uncharacterized repeat protein (TIGR02543 family)